MRKSNLLLKKRNKYHQLLSFQSKNKTDREVSTSYALSFYTSQTVLGWSKFFVPDQKFQKFVNFSCSNFVKGADISKILEESQKNSNDIRFLWLLF